MSFSFDILSYQALVLARVEERVRELIGLRDCVRKELAPVLVKERVWSLSLEHIDAEGVFGTGGEAMMISGYSNSMTDTTKKERVSKSHQWNSFFIIIISIYDTKTLPDDW